MTDDVQQGTPTLVDRVNRLEEQYNTFALTDDEEQTLADRVSILGTSATTLAEALAKVDKNQQGLLALNTKVKDVEARHKEQILKLRHRLFSVIVVAVIVTGASIFGFTAYAKAKDDAANQYATATRTICEQRGEQSRIIRKYLDDQLKTIEASPDIPPAQKELAKKQASVLKQAFPVIDCSTLRY